MLNGLNCCIKSYEQLKEILLKKFEIKYTDAEIYQKLSAKKKKDNENCEEYFYKMKEIAAMQTLMILH